MAKLAEVGARPLRRLYGLILIKPARGDHKLAKASRTTRADATMALDAPKRYLETLSVARSTLPAGTQSGPGSAVVP
jgi:hypothetical protein